MRGTQWLDEVSTALQPSAATGSSWSAAVPWCAPIGVFVPPVDVCEQAVLPLPDSAPAIISEDAGASTRSVQSRER